MRNRNDKRNLKLLNKRNAKQLQNGKTNPIINLVPETLVSPASTILQPRSNDLFLLHIIMGERRALSQSSLSDLPSQTEKLQCLQKPMHLCIKDKDSKKHQRIFVLPAILQNMKVKITARKFTLYLGAGLYIKYRLDVSSYCSRKS